MLPPCLLTLTNIDLPSITDNYLQTLLITAAHYLTILPENRNLIPRRAARAV